MTANKEYFREYYLRNREKILNRQAERLKSCCYAPQKKYYWKNREQELERSKSYYNARVEWYREFKSTLMCSECGSVGNVDFHHIDPESKLFNISDKAKNKDVSILISEINKCEIYCRSCHNKKR